MSDDAGRSRGMLADWNDDRGFGFITPEDGGARVFAHISMFPRGRRPVAGREVTYVATRDERNRPQASDIRYVGERPARGSKPDVLLALAIATMFFGALAVLVSVDQLSLLVVGVYVLMSGFAFLSYWVDKSAARNGEWRLSEDKLHMIALLGGWPGALVAQQVFRHKTTKQPFQTIFWITVAANGAALTWFVYAAPLA